jgi:hypothetical protein
VSSIELELALVALGAMLSPTTLTFSVLALVLGERPLRTGAWFFAGAFTVTIVIGLIAAFVLGNAAASSEPSTPKTWVAIVDLVAGAALAAYVWRTLHRPARPERTEAAIERMSRVASSPAIAILAAGATLANPGGFIPLALKDISEMSPGAVEYILLWLLFTVIALLPLTVAVVMLAVAPEPTQRALGRARVWLERRARVIAAVLLSVLAASLLSHGIAGVTS